MRTITIVLFLMFMIRGISQSHFYKSFSFEVGAGYNTAKWKTIDHYFDTTINFSRSAFSVQPSVRLSYSIPIGKVDSSGFVLTPFIGYYISGGKYVSDTSGYIDILKCNSMEVGALIDKKIWKHLSIGVGIKGQYLASVVMKYYGYSNQPNSDPREWGTRDFSDLYHSFAANAGFQLKYRFKHLSLACEGWLGFTNLSSFSNSMIEVRVIENNYRVLVGWRF